MHLPDTGRRLVQMSRDLCATSTALIASSRSVLGGARERYIKSLLLCRWHSGGGRHGRPGTGDAHKAVEAEWFRLFLPKHRDARP